MTILEKLGITPQRVYKKLFNNGPYSNLYNNFEINIWPTYSKMLEKFINRAIYRDKNRIPNGDEEKIIEEATGLTWDEIKEKL